MPKDSCASVLRPALLSAARRLAPDGCAYILSVMKRNFGRLARVCVCTTAALLTACGLCQVIASFAVAQSAAGVEWGSQGAPASGLRPDYVGPTLLRYRIGGALTVLAGAVLFLRRRRFACHLRRLARSFGVLFRDAARHVRLAVRQDGVAYTVALLLILALAFALRGLHLRDPICYDEAFTFLVYASRPFSEALSDYSTPNNHLFHTLLVRLSCLCLGGEPWSLRLPAFVAGLLLVPVAYVVLRALLGKDAALISTALLASSPALIGFSANARGYSLVGLLSLLLIGLGKHLKHRLSAAGWLLFAVFGALGLYTIPVMLFPLGAVLLWLVLSAIKGDCLNSRTLIKRLIISCIITCALTAALYWPVVSDRGIRQITANPYVTPKTWQTFTSRLPASARALWRQWNLGMPHVISAVVVAGCAASLLLHRRLSTDRVPFLVVALVWGGLLMLGRRVVPLARTWLFLLPLYFGHASAGVLYVARRTAIGDRGCRSRLFPILCVLLAASLTGYVGATSAVADFDRGGASSTLRDAEEIALFLKTRLRPGDRVVAMCPCDAPLRYYFMRHKVPVAYMHTDIRKSRRALLVVDPKRQTVGRLLKVLGVARLGFGDPRAMRRFGNGVVYELRKQ